jgi:hypothetical protein
VIARLRAEAYTYPPIIASILLGKPEVIVCLDVTLRFIVTNNIAGERVLRSASIFHIAMVAVVCVFHYSPPVAQVPYI